MKDMRDLHLDLLRYALGKKGKREGHDYYIALKGKLCRTSGMAELCLQENEDNSWTIYFEERGNKSAVATLYSGSSDAVDFFFHLVTSGPGPFDYREEWERDTGLQF